MADISQTIFPGAFSWMETILFWLKFHWSLFLRCPIDNKPALVLIMLTGFTDVYAAPEKALVIGLPDHRVKVVSMSDSKALFSNITITFQFVLNSWISVNIKSNLPTTCVVLAIVAKPITLWKERDVLYHPRLSLTWIILPFVVIVAD